MTENMYVYEYENEMLLVDCGIGFPDQHMPGVDILIPDISYIQDKATEGKEIVGMLLSHGHDDHIGALPYLLDQLPPFPIFASPLTAGFAANRIAEGAQQREIKILTDRKPMPIGQYFTATSLAITHSVPDSKHFLIETPVGNIYHGSDFKLDKSPIDGVLPDYEFIQAIKNRGINLMLMDCLGVEKNLWGKSESTVAPVLHDLMASTRGKFVVTLMSSHIHRIQSVIDAAAKLGRRVVLVGTSIEKNVKVALSLRKLRDEQGVLIDKKRAPSIADEKLCLIVAGAQGQEGSAMMRAIYGEHKEITIKAKDRVVFSADAIPGNEVNYFGAIDELCSNGVETIYPEINDSVHQSGHAKRLEQQELLSLVAPKLVMPIGGNDRHRFQFHRFVASKLGYKKEQVLLPEAGDILSLSPEGVVSVFDHINLQSQIVDGLGIGDVGPTVLADRRILSEAGILMVIVKRYQGKLSLDDITVVSRGFVFMQDAKEVVTYVKNRTAEILQELYHPNIKYSEVERAVEKRLARDLYKIIKREPMVEVELLDV